MMHRYFLIEPSYTDLKKWGQVFQNYILMLMQDLKKRVSIKFFEMIDIANAVNTERYDTVVGRNLCNSTPTNLKRDCIK